MFYNSYFSDFFTLLAGCFSHLKGLQRYYCFFTKHMAQNCQNGLTVLHKRAVCTGKNIPATVWVGVIFLTFSCIIVLWGRKLQGHPIQSEPFQTARRNRNMQARFCLKNLLKSCDNDTLLSGEAIWINILTQKRYTVHN